MLNNLDNYLLRLCVLFTERYNVSEKCIKPRPFKIGTYNLAKIIYPNVVNE